MVTNSLGAVVMVGFWLILFLMCRLQQPKEEVQIRRGFASRIGTPPQMPENEIKFYYV